MPDRLPPDVIDHWPEVFSYIEIKAVPLEYITEIIINFEDGQIWEIDLADKKFNNPDIDLSEAVEEVLEAFFEEYDEYITNVDFRLNTQKVIRDISKRVKQFMKKRK